MFIESQNTTTYTKKITDIIGSNDKRYTIIDCDNVEVHNISTTAYGLIISANIDLSKLTIPNNIEFMHISVRKNQKMIDDMCKVIPSSVKTLFIKGDNSIHINGDMIPDSVTTLIVFNINIGNLDNIHSGVITLGLNDISQIPLDNKLPQFTQVQLIGYMGTYYDKLAHLGQVVYDSDNVSNDNIITTRNDALYPDYKVYKLTTVVNYNATNLIPVDSSELSELYKTPNVNIKYHDNVEITHISKVYMLDMLNALITYDITTKEYWMGYVSKSCHVDENNRVKTFGNTYYKSRGEFFERNRNSIYKLMEDIRNYPNKRKNESDDKIKRLSKIVSELVELIH